MKRSACVSLAVLLPAFAVAQDSLSAVAPVAGMQESLSAAGRLTVVRENRQQTFSKEIPAGNYSGITYIGNNRYALVNDKSATDGFVVFRIELDSVSGRILSVTDEGVRSAGSPNRDMEGVAFFMPDSTVFVSGEKDNRILEHTLDGRYTGRELAIPEEFRAATPNYGLESLTYNATTHRFWTITESTLPADGPQASYAGSVRNLLRLQSFGDDLQPACQYFYEMDEPEAHAVAAEYAMGVSGLCALDDGRLIVLEREFFVPKSKLGAFVNCKLYVVAPSAARPGEKLGKTELLTFKTKLTLFNYGLANYEGLCLGPKLADGNLVLLLVSDSQNRYKGVLKDWFKTVVISFGE